MVTNEKEYRVLIHDINTRTRKTGMRVNKYTRYEWNAKREVLGKQKGVNDDD